MNLKTEKKAKNARNVKKTTIQRMQKNANIEITGKKTENKNAEKTRVAKIRRMSKKQRMQIMQKMPRMQKKQKSA